jgi:hypothetical protein
MSLNGVIRFGVLDHLAQKSSSLLVGQYELINIKTVNRQYEKWYIELCTLYIMSRFFTFCIGRPSLKFYEDGKMMVHRL